MVRGSAIRAVGAISLVLALGICSLAVASTAAPSTSRLSASTSAVYGSTSDPGTLDWQVRGSTVTYQASFPAYDRLVSWDRDTKKIVPYLATSWKIVPANRPKSITFQLRRDATCSDGSRVTPLVILNSFKRWITVRKIQDGMPNLFGKGPYHLSINQKKWTFTFRSETPYAQMLAGFAAAGIVCPNGLAAAAKDPSALQLAQYGSGPYELVQYVPKQKIEWKKRPEWKWGPPGTNIKNMPDSLTWRIVSDTSTLSNLIVTGEVDFAAVAGPDAIRLAGMSSLVHKRTPNYIPVGMVFNQSASALTSNENVRAAIMTAYDRNEFMQAGFGKSYVVTNSYFGPPMACYDKNLGAIAPKMSVSRARQYLQAAGYQLSGNVMMKDGKPLKIVLLASPSYFGGIGQYLASKLQDVGFDVELHDYPAATWVSNLTSGNYDVSLFTAFQTAPVPFFQGLQYYGPPSLQNFKGNYGAGVPNFWHLALLTSQYTDCKWALQLQELAIKRHVIDPVGMFVSDAFGTKKWDFPANLLTFDPRWLKPGS